MIITGASLLTAWVKRGLFVVLVNCTYACLLQWEIYDAYIADQEKQRAQEEVNKQKAAAKKATTATEAAETSQDPAKACSRSHCMQDGCCALNAFVHFFEWACLAC